MRTIFLIALFSICAAACNQPKTEHAQVNISGNSQGPVATSEGGSAAQAETAGAKPVQNSPRTVVDFFRLLPEKYFTLEGCDRDIDKDCSKARTEYLKTFTEVEDIKNGYFKGGCDGAQSCIEMAIFKRPDDTYLVGVATFAEMMNDFYFLDYSGGKWIDVSTDVVPDFSKQNWYELPRFGTTMKVFEKKVTERTEEFEISEKGRQIYELSWKDGKFTRK